MKIVNENMEWIYGIWFVPGDQKDFMGVLGKENGNWVFAYRFRYYSQESVNPHDDKDEKSLFRLVLEDGKAESLPKLLSTIKEMVSMCQGHFGSSADFVDFVDLQCATNDPKIFFELGSRSWAHLQRKEE